MNAPPARTTKSPRPREAVPGPRLLLNIGGTLMETLDFNKLRCKTCGARPFSQVTAKQIAARYLTWRFAWPARTAPTAQHPAEIEFEYDPALTSDH